MRTVADLREALIACEQPPPPVERFLANIPGGVVADEISIVATPARRRYRPALWITAAAVAAAVIAGSVVLIQGAGTHSHAVNDPSPNATRALTKDELALPFRLDPSAGLVIHSVGIEASSADLTLADSAGRTYMLVLSDSHIGEHEPDHVASVSINGHPATYSDLVSVGQTRAASGTPSAGASIDSGSTTVPSAGPAPGITRRLQFDYETGRTLLFQTLGGPTIPKDVFLQLARAIVIDPAQPVSIPFSVKAAPAGLGLSGLFVQSPSSTHEWSYGARYWTTGSADPAGDSIALASTPGVTASTEGAVPKTVAGHRAYWLSRLDAGDGSQLTVELAVGVYLNVGQIANSAPGEQSFAQLAAIAESVTLAPGSDDLGTWFGAKTWFDAAKALPLGS